MKIVLLVGVLLLVGSFASCLTINEDEPEEGEETVHLSQLSPFTILATRDNPLLAFLKSIDVNGDDYLDAADFYHMYLRFSRTHLELAGPLDTLRAPSDRQLQDIIRLWRTPSSSSLSSADEEEEDAARLSIEDVLHYITKELQKLGNFIDGFYPMSAIEETHLALTGVPSEMRVSFSTPTRPLSAVVRYGFDPQNLNLTAPAVTVTYRTHNKLLGLLDLGYIYNGYISHATLTSIPEQTTVYYQCSNGTDNGPIFSFKSPANQKQGATRFAALGDQGPFFPAGFKVAQQIAALEDLDLVLHAGDLAYAGTSGSASGGEFEFIWDWWSRQNEKFAAFVPYMLTVGNHEQFYNFTSFIHRFDMPQNGNGNFWYSYDVGFLHVLSFSSEHPYQPGSPQHDFIVSDLRNATARLHQYPWIIVVDHRPLYCSDADEWTAHNGDPSTSELSVYIEPLLMQYRVPLVISGHMHVFERTYPVYNATPSYPSGVNVYSTDVAAPIYITVGSGGIFLDEDWIEPAPAWSAYRASEWGVAIVEANATTLHYQFQSTLDEAIKDEFWLNKP